MADQKFNVNCGFFDAVNNDRTYTADQMNLPYKRVITNGVFATPQGTPSTDLQVESTGNGMQIIVNPGEGLFADKWFNNPSVITITVPSNTGITPRIDSVIVQVDETISGRVGNIVYRQGTPASNPSAPAINTVENVTEYRVANIYVAPSANTINNDAITDLRGSSSCPWVTSLIYQVDTSTLWNQFNSAYAQQYEEYTEDYEEYVSEQRTAWEAFIQTLTDDLTVSTNVVMFENIYTATGSVTNIPIGIASFDPDTDILQVFINGLLAVEGDKYTVNTGGTSITLTNAIAAGNSVSFVVFKSLIGADIESAVSMIQRLNDKIDSFISDGGWINFSLESGATAYSSSTKPGVRCINNRVYLRGAVKGVTSAGTVICTVPVAYRPAVDHTYIVPVISSTSVADTAAITISASNGQVKIVAVSSSLPSGAMIPIATEYLANTGLSVASVYEYMGSVQTYADLPEGANTGDVYTVETADSTHNIAAGDDVMWNGSEWEPFTQVVSSAEIDTIIDTIS